MFPSRLKLAVLPPTPPKPLTFWKRNRHGVVPGVALASMRNCRAIRAVTGIAFARDDFLRRGKPQRRVEADLDDGFHRKGVRRRVVKVWSALSVVPLAG